MTKSAILKHQTILTRTFIAAWYLISLLMASGLSAQQSEKNIHLYVTSYGTEQGLNQSMVAQVIQDNRGLIWMVTGDGLQCFDGNEFRSFRVSDSGNGNPSDNMMREIVEYRPGGFIISTSSSILSFNSSSGKFHIIAHKAGYYPRVLTNLCAGLPMAWLADKKLACIKGDRIIPVKLQFLDKEPVPDNFFATHDVITSNGDLLLDSDDGILVIEGLRDSIRNENKARWIRLRNGCQGIARDRSGNALILSGDQVLRYTGGGNLEPVVKTNRFSTGHLFADSKGTIWISDRAKKELYRIRDGITSQVNVFTRERNHSYPLTPDVITVFEDKQGNLWFGTDGDGLFCHTPGQLQFYNAKTGFTRCLGSLNNSIYAGTYRNGVWRLSEDLSVASRVRIDNLPADLYFLDMLADRRGRLWLATSEGLYITDSSGSIIYKQAHTVKTAKLLNYSADTILCIFGNQLQIFSTAGKPVLLDTLMFANARAFCKTGIYCWFGTPFGLYIADVSDGIKSLRNVFVHRPIHPEAVYALLLHEGIIWSATDHGIKRYSVAGKLLPALPVTQELLNHVIYALVPDQHNRIWFSSNRGIGCISEKRDRIIWFNTRNNLQSLEFNSNAFLRNQQGWIYFGGINGINGLNPQHFNPVKTMPEIRLITLSISDTSYSGGIPPEHLHLDIDWRSPHVSGSVFTTDYLNPEMQQFSFYLEGYQSDWGKMSSDPSFSYRNLPPGKYRLLVKCTDAYKNISGEVCLLTIRIKPPFWKTWWFAIFSAIALLCITILIVRKLQEMRYRDKLHKLEKQNAVNRERLRIAKDMHDEVGASLTRISILSELAKNGKQSQEESMKTISQISDISGNVVDEMSEIIWAMNPKNDSLDSFAAYLRRYASGYLETAGIEGKFPFPDDIQPVAMSAELRRNVFLTAKEALHNMVKHSGATEAEVRLEYYGKKLELSLRDNGNGFDIESKTGSGNGLINMQKRIQELGGEFSVTSTVGKGTEVRLVVILG